LRASSASPSSPILNNLHHRLFHRLFGIQLRLPMLNEHPTGTDISALSSVVSHSRWRLLIVCYGHHHLMRESSKRSPKELKKLPSGTICNHNIRWSATLCTTRGATLFACCHTHTHTHTHTRQANAQVARACFLNNDPLLWLTRRSSTTVHQQSTSKSNLLARALPLPPENPTRRKTTVRESFYPYVHEHSISWWRHMRSSYQTN